jgi:hypothetical protein
LNGYVTSIPFYWKFLIIWNICLTCSIVNSKNFNLFWTFMSKFYVMNYELELKLERIRKPIFQKLEFSIFNYKFSFGKKWKNSLESLYVNGYSSLTHKGIFLVFSFWIFFWIFAFLRFCFSKRNKWCSNFQRFSTRHFRKICKVGVIVHLKQSYVLSINEISTLKN